MSRTFYWVIGLIVILNCVGPASESNAQITGLPTAPPIYKVNISSDWATDGSGCRPIRVTVETIPLKPSTDDQQFTISFSAENYRDPGMTWTVPLTIQAGQSSGQAELLVPNTGRNYYNSQLIVERGEGNQKFDFGRDLLSTNIDISQNDESSIPSTLIVSSNFSGPQEVSHVCYKGPMAATQSAPAIYSNAGSIVPALGNLYKLHDGTQTTQGSGMTNASVLRLSEKFHACRPQDLPVNWIGLSGIKQVLISHPDFLNLCRNYDPQREAVEKWVATGGTLIVFSTGDNYENADELFPLLLGRQRSSELGPLQHEWREPAEQVRKIKRLISPTSTHYDNSYRDEAVWVSQDEMDLGITESQTESTTGLLKKLPGVNDWPVHETAEGAQPKSPFLLAPYLNGRIVAVPSNMTTWRVNDWRVLHNAVELDSRNSSPAIGVELADRPYGAFRIPGVGEPPLKAFQVLITLFILVAGPLMYLVLRKTRRLQLLFALVPLLSGAVCLGLFAYAIFVDGLGNWGRVQSVSFFDHGLKSAVTLSRSAYYCGTQPAPYEFTADTLSLSPISRSSRPQVNRQTPSSNSISGGNLRPRTPHQVVSIRSHESDRRLQLLPAIESDKSEESSEAAGPRIGNQLGAKVLYLAVRTENGIFTGKDLADATITTLENQPKKDAQVAADIRQQIQDLSSAEDGYYTGRATNSYGGYNNSYAMTADYGGQDTVGQLQAGKAMNFLSQPNRYIAILERFPMVDEQIESVQYKNQLHVIIGKW